jgi:hypothetical protein
MSDSSFPRQSTRSSTFIVSESLFPPVSPKFYEELLLTTTAHIVPSSPSNMCCFLFPSVVSSRVFLSTSMLPLVQGADGSEVVGQTTKQASFCVTLLLMTLLRERTFQEIIGLQ